ncbi:MAG: tRNA guanosine(34) transglycosylase Tgt [Myxococcota bacterium]
MPAGFAFDILAREGAARCGRLSTPHGTIDTPAFLCVATFGAVRGVAPDELEQLGAQMLLANTYHLGERPGEQVVAAQGGLHGFTGWRRPWLTDSGGYQVTSLVDRMRVEEEGIRFTSTLDGTRRLLTPESAIATQEALGADIAMVLDECRPAKGDDADGTLGLEIAMERSLRWAERSRQAHKRPDQALFGIVQGGLSEGLRRRSARATLAIGFDGLAHGGLGLGEDPERRMELVTAVHDEAPDQTPRYLMGLGKPVDLLDGIACGVDLFDCVVPTRNGRHGQLFTSEGTLQIRSARYKNDPAPPDADCDCPTCARFSRAYLCHLIRSEEALGARLASIHNIRFYLRLLERARRAITAGRFAALRRAY